MINYFHNPYIVGRPIHQNERLYGRDDIFHFITEQLKQNEKIIVLHGQRRMGMTSLLHHIPNILDPEEFVFISLSLEDKSYKSLVDILYDIERDILDTLDISKKEVNFIKKRQLELDNLLFSTQFLPQIRKKINNKKVLLSFDEFDVLWNEDIDTIHPFINYLKFLIDRQENLFIILVLGRRLKDISPINSIFGLVPQKQIKVFDQNNTTLLITEPAKGILEYESDAIEAILKFSGGNPYFIQTLCFAVFQQAKETNKNRITSNDIENIIEQALEIGEGGLIGSWDMLSIPEKLVLLAVVEVQERAIDSSSYLVSPFTLLAEYDIEIGSKLIKAGENLVQREILKKVVDQDLSTNKLPKYQISSELFRRWLLKRHNLSDEIVQLKTKFIQS